MTCNVKKSLYFLFFSFYLFVAFFHAVIFVLVQPAMEGVEVRISVEAQEGVVVVFGFAVTCGSVVDRVHCAFECSEPYCLFVAELY